MFLYDVLVLCVIYYTIFSMIMVIFYAFITMMSPRSNEITHFLTDP